MSEPVRRRARRVSGSPVIADVSYQDAEAMLREAVEHLETAMRLLAYAILLRPALDDVMGIEAQRLRGVRDVMKGELESEGATRS